MADIESTDAKTAKAEAKAAKARAKALRPFYKKKRYWALAGIAAIAIAAAAGAGGGDSSDTASTAQGESSTAQGEGSSEVSQGLGSKDATADIEELDCGSPDALGIVYPSVTVRNNSSKPSNYSITIVMESSDRSVKYDETYVFISNLLPGQTQTEEGLFTSELPDGAICRISEVQRTAA